jgi:hypothetical protein
MVFLEGGDCKGRGGAGLGLGSGVGGGAAGSESGLCRIGGVPPVWGADAAAGGEAQRADALRPPNNETQQAKAKRRPLALLSCPPTWEVHALAPSRSTNTGGTSGSPPGVKMGDILRVLKTWGGLGGGRFRAVWGRFRAVVGLGVLERFGDGLWAVLGGVLGSVGRRAVVGDWGPLMCGFTALYNPHINTPTEGRPCRRAATCTHTQTRQVANCDTAKTQPEARLRVGVGAVAFPPNPQARSSPPNHPYPQTWLLRVVLGL